MNKKDLINYILKFIVVIAMIVVIICMVVTNHLILALLVAGCWCAITVDWDLL